jgi:DNA repair protein RecN (Recombination protein N)
MLRFLRIRNLAVIEAVEVEFEPGFNVLTGETGAGKSILVEAVGLLLGGRASSDLVRTGEPHASIEAIFENPGDGREILLRREITSQGRSRSFVDGALATASALREVAERLVELHGQHEHQRLLDPTTHLPLLDGHGGLREDAEAVAAAWHTMRGLREQLDRSRMDSREKAARVDLIAFQLGEIDKAAPKPGEDEQLAATKQVLASAERVQRLCQDSYATLYDSDGAVLEGLAAVWKRLGELAGLDPRFAPYLDSRDGIKSQLEDLAFFLRGYGESIDASPDRLREVEDRLAGLERLKRRYGPTLADVLETAESLRRERDLLTRADENVDEVERRLATARDAFLRLARSLSKRRRKAAARFAADIEGLLGELAMTRSRFEVRFNEADPAEDAWTEQGVDQAEFFISPNPGEELRPLARIVSGGELSRVMLALKTLAVGGERGRTLIFDEVDAGIGGRVADVVGSKLRGLGYDFQVLCITHLPQIAARATTQYRIEKHVRGDRTVTTVERLDDKGRVDEIARMIGGASVTASVRASAGDLIAGSGAKGKQNTKGESETAARRNRLS